MKRSLQPAADRTLKNISISDKVQYQYQEFEGRRSNEGLVASDRWYPGILIDKQFYSGLHMKNQFLPGITWCGRFVPGMLTRRGFFPGLVQGSSIHPGIIAAGVFVPGIVNGKNFVPGIMIEERFIPGCFTTNRLFAPGRIVQGRFESGVIDRGNFLPTGYEMLAPADARNLAKEGYALETLRRYEPVGGLAIRGMVYGAFRNTLAVLPQGLLSNEGVVLGGLWINNSLIVQDPMEDLKKALEDLGFDIGDGGVGLPGQNNGLKDRIEKLIQGFQNPFGEFGGMWNAGPSGTNLNDALEGLGAGINALIDGLNKSFSAGWDDMCGNADGWVTQGGDTPWISIGTAAGAGGGVAGAGIRVIIALTGGEALTASMVTVPIAVGTAAGAVVGLLVWSAVTSTGGNAEPAGAQGAPGQPTPPPDDGGTGGSGGGPKAPGEPGGQGDPGFTVGPRREQLMPHLINRNVVISFKHESDESFTFNLKKPLITFSVTDTGVIAVVNWAGFREVIRTHSGQSGTIFYNPLTGNVMFTVGNVVGGFFYDPETTGLRDLPFWLQPVVH